MRTLLAALALLVPVVPADAGPPRVAWEQIRSIPRDCPVVYDNDWLRDVTDDEYLFALASLGRANLRGIVLSKDEWDHGRLYKVQQGLDDFREDIAAARRSGWKDIPDVTVGADRLLDRPASGRVEDARPVSSPGTDMIVAEARKATPEKPLVVVVGGPLGTVASAYLTDPSIADRMLVLMTDIDGYNGSDPWANFVVATRCRLVNFGAHPLWWPQRPDRPVMPLDRFDPLPDRPVTREMRRVAAMFWERSTRKEKPDRDDGLGDGAGTFLMFRPESWRAVKRVRVTGPWSHEDATGDDYDYLDATGIDPRIVEDEFFATVAAALGQGSAEKQAATRFPTKVSDNRRYLLAQDGKPFFYLGDTAWELFHRLDREEADLYLRDRAAKKFTVIQAVVLAEHGGLDVPNPYGHLPLVGKDPTRPVEDYFKHVDFLVNRADELGLVVGMLPTWGSWWHDKGAIFTPESAESYGEFLGKRYKDKPILWILGGDRPVENDRQRAIIRAMARGLAKGDGGRHLMTFHPPGGRSSTDFVRDEPWLAGNMIQSGHGFNHENFRPIAADYARTPTKPCQDGEPGYEDHPAEFNPKNGYLDAWETRKFAYWALFAGAHGHTYGCHDIWQFFDGKRSPITAARTPWREARDIPGAGQMQFARALLESRPFLTRIPDQSLLASDPGRGADHVQATRDEAGSYAFIYSASGRPFTVDIEKLAGKELRAWWFDPRTGKAEPIGTFARSGRREFTPPSRGKGKDWVLVLDDAARGFKAPGARDDS